jgi:streptomycin 6-kinase
VAHPLVPDTVRNKALAVGAQDWLERLPGLVGEIEREWSIEVGRPFPGGTEAFVAEAALAGGEEVVLKLLIPRTGAAAQNEATVLRLANGEGCARLLNADVSRSALLIERLGPALNTLGIPIAARHEILCAAAQRLWRPAPDCGLPSGAEKGRWLIDSITRGWHEVGRPCSERSVDHALLCAGHRIAAHDDERAVLVHGDVHQWNALQSGDGYKLIDPDGLLAEAEYDMGILMREDPAELLAGGSHRRAQDLAARTGLDATAIWEWGVVERVSTGLICLQVGLEEEGRNMLAVADRLSAA